MMAVYYIYIYIYIYCVAISSYMVDWCISTLLFKRLGLVRFIYSFI